MEREEINKLINESIRLASEEKNLRIREAIAAHAHDGILSKQINYDDLFGNSPSNIIATPITIATTGNTDWYIIVPISGRLISIDFSGVDALAASDTNYITFSIVNLGQAGAGSTAMLAATDANTTKATGGTALAANTRRELVISAAIGAGEAIEGDRLRIRAAVTNTLANTVTFPTYLLRFK